MTDFADIISLENDVIDALERTIINKIEKADWIRDEVKELLITKIQFIGSRNALETIEMLLEEMDEN